VRYWIYQYYLTSTLLVGESGITEVQFTDHAFERVDGSEKSRCKLPDSIIEKWILRRRGNQFYDKEEDTLLFIHQKTVVVTDYDPRKDIWVVVTVYRSQSPGKQGLDRYSEVEPEDFKESRRQSQ
jgi:nickel-dependent lactate racemase